MGILKPHINILCMEQKKRPVIKGSVLTLGQQAVYSTLENARTILNRNGVMAKDLPPGFDTANKIPAWEGTRNGKNTNAQSLLTLLGADEVYVADVSAYENPDFIIDLNVPVEAVYHQRFDTIIDVGTLEHVFDIRVALENLCTMLKPGGSIILILPCSNAIDHGFYSFSPTLFFDYFGTIGFSSLGCYLREGSPYIYEKKGRLFKYERVGKEIPIMSNQLVELAFVATKYSDQRPQEIVKPIQGIYRENKYWQTGVVVANSGRAPLWSKIKKCIWSVIWSAKDFCPVFLEKLFYGRARATNLKFLGNY